jgi:glycosyltransferase involved in cell wall biosynthesis
VDGLERTQTSHMSLVGPPAPLISVVIPAFNAEPFVRDAIESVLRQSYSPIECVVVDDGSFDGTGDAVAQYGGRVRLISQQNHGVARARNRGAAEGRGELLAFLDADDVWLPERLAMQARALRRGAAVAVLCAATEVDRYLRPIVERRVTPKPLPETMLLQQGSLVSCSSNMLIKHSTFDEIGGFHHALSVSADWDFLLRLLEVGALEYVDEPLVLYRRHVGNMSTDIPRMARDMSIAYREAFARQPGLAPIRRQAYARLHWMLAGSSYNTHKWSASVRHIGKALFYRPSFAIKLAHASIRRWRSAGRRVAG